MSLLDVFNHIVTLQEIINANVEKLQQLDSCSSEYKQLFNDTARLIDEKQFYINQLDALNVELESYK